MPDVILIGEPMGLFTAQEYGELKDVTLFKRSLAGAEINVGIGLSRLDYKVEYVTKLGKDPIGAYIEEAIEKEKIGTSYIFHSPKHNTGLMMKNKVQEGDPSTAYYRNNSAFTTLSEADVNRIDFSDVKLLHITGIPPAVSGTVREAIVYLMKKAKSAGTFISFDPNLRPALWSSEDEMVTVLNNLAGLSDLVLPGVSEGKTLFGTDDVEAIARFYIDKGAQVVITKNGADGAFVTEKGKDTINVPGFKVQKVVDTVGAGDGFAVGVLHGYLNGLTWPEAALRANAIGSLQVQNEGDNEGLPSLEELTTYIENY
ncbi:sugar kinase [Alkalibacterium thalassium]|uniref:2-keto-3-deoxygluconate kinase n=1 Tax=Alkalibacterium thalassium TaxID=426701 RepID=A0A1G9G187_9LACT|nr:sugar kinase [Alkalibacterium thalassium]SDK94404.1 2-keto-3-deoxygluconate kinase [Alkalibacterium thalassium]